MYKAWIQSGHSIAANPANAYNLPANFDGCRQYYEVHG
jgi:hypothetical protein